MPLADIFVGAIACLLILIIVARQTREQINQIPQADYVYKCTREASDLLLQADSMKTETKKMAPLDLSQFEKKISRLHHSGRLSVRILVYAREQDAGMCRKRIRKLIEKLNRLYETPDKKPKPSSFLLFDMAPLK